MKNFLAPTSITPEQAAALQAAREQALNQIIRGVVAVAVVAVAGFSLTAFVYGTWSLVGLYALILVALMVLAVLRRLPLKWRGGVFVTLLYLVSLIATLNVGLGSASRLFLVAFAVLVTTIFGWRAGVAAAALALVTWLAFAVGFGVLGLQASAPNSSSVFIDWISAGASMLLIMVALMIPQRQFLESRQQTVVTSQEMAELQTTRARLAEQAHSLERVSREALHANERLEEQAGQLERRAALLTLSAEVAHAATAVRDLDELLDTSVQLVATRFNYYHAGLFLLDDAREWAILRAANSTGGHAMLARGHRLRVGHVGIVGYVTGTGQPRIALDVGADAVHFANPDLPETHSEMAVPINARGVLIGALDVQSVEVNAFSAKDVRVLQTLADQLGVAIDNARLIQETQRRVAELQALQQVSRAPAQLRGPDEPLAFRYDGVDVEPLAGLPATPLSADVKSAGDFMAVPLRFGSLELGVLELRRAGEPWTADDVALTNAVAERMALALESAQLFEGTRARAQQLAELSQASLEFTGPQFSTPQVLEGVTRAARRLFDVDGASVWLPAGSDQIELAVSHHEAAGRRLRRAEGLAGSAYASGRAERTGDRLAVPMLWQGQTLGVLELTHSQPDRLFTPDDENVAQLFAAQAASTLENARLFAETQQRLSDLATINTISQSLAAQLDRQAMAETVSHHVSRAFGHEAIVALYDRQTNLIEIPYFVGDDGQRLAIPPFVLGEGLTSHVIQTRRPLLINSDTEARVAALGARQEGAPARSWLGVPILLGEAVLGVLSVQDVEREGLFTDNDVRLLTTIAANVGVSLQNVRLFEQTQERAAELAVVNELARAISEQLEPTQVLQTVYDQIQRVTALDGFFVTLYDHQTGLQTTPLIYEGGRRTEEGPRPLPARGLIRHVIDSGQVVLINRTPPEVEQIALSPEHAMGHASRVAASLLYLPLHFGQQVAGVMSVQSYAYNAYGQRQVEVLTAVANHVVVALQNARLFEETERRAEQLAASGEVARATISVLNPDELIVQAVELIRDRFERSAGVYYAALFLVDESGQWARLRHATGNAGRALLERQHKLEVGGNSMVGWTTANRRARIAVDVGAEPVRFANPLLPHTRSELALPLTVGDTVLGALDVQSTKSGAFSEADVAVLQTMADQVAVALQNARLFERTARQARRERLVVDITSKIRATNDMDSMLRTAVDELRRALGTSHAAVRFSPPAGTAEAAGRRAANSETGSPRLPAPDPTPPNPPAADHSDRPAGGSNGAHRNGANGAHGAGG